MTASFQWLDPLHWSCLIRVHAAGGRLGDPYTWTAVAKRHEHDRERAEVMGLCGSGGRMRGVVGAVRQALRDAGFRRYDVERRHGKGVRARRVVDL